MNSQSSNELPCLVKAFLLHAKVYDLQYTYQFNKQDSDHPAQNANQYSHSLNSKNVSFHCLQLFQQKRAYWRNNDNPLAIIVHSRIQLFFSGAGGLGVRPNS